MISYWCPVCEIGDECFNPPTYCPKCHGGLSYRITDDLKAKKERDFILEEQAKDNDFKFGEPGTY